MNYTHSLFNKKRRKIRIDRSIWEQHNTPSTRTTEPNTVDINNIDEWFRTEFNRILDKPSSEICNKICLGNQIWQALNACDVDKIVELYNIALSELPYENFSDNNKQYHNEFWYRSMFIMLLRGAGVVSYPEVHTLLGKSDLVIQIDNNIIVLEFKFVAKTEHVKTALIQGAEQVINRRYAKGYEADKTVRCAVIVADDEERQVVGRVIQFTK